MSLCVFGFQTILYMYFPIQIFIRTMYSMVFPLSQKFPLPRPPAHMFPRICHISWEIMRWQTQLINHNKQLTTTPSRNHCFQKKNTATPTPTHTFSCAHPHTHAHTHAHTHHTSAAYTQLNIHIPHMLFTSQCVYDSMETTPTIDDLISSFKVFSFLLLPVVTTIIITADVDCITTQHSPQAAQYYQCSLIVRARQLYVCVCVSCQPGECYYPCSVSCVCWWLMPAAGTLQQVSMRPCVCVCTILVIECVCVCM